MNTTPRLLADPTDADHRQGACADCGHAVIWVHGMWVRTDGNEVCVMAPRTLRHTVAD